MKFRLRAMALGVAILSSTTIAAPPKPAETRLSMFSRELRFALPPEFVQVTNRRNDTHVLIEYVPKGESVANWTLMITVQAYRGLGRSPASTAQIARQAFYPAACTNGPIYHDSGEVALGDRLRRSLIVNGCASLPKGAYPKAKTGAGEQDFILIFRDDETVWTLNYAERRAPFDGKSPPVAFSRGEALLRKMFGEVVVVRPR
ncbi:MAG: hypothetical protein IPL18_08815 [Sphingomonadales bacterium]|nr:hypothetical protein [Sphingomonadales bacterium]